MTMFSANDMEALMTNSTYVPRMAQHGRTTCPHCGGAVTNGAGCKGPELEADSPDWTAIEERKRLGTLRRDAPMPRCRRQVIRAARPYGDLWPQCDYCPDCGAGLGQFHHWACDLEQCPACEDQLYSCDCGSGEAA